MLSQMLWLCQFFVIILCISSSLTVGFIVSNCTSSLYLVWTPHIQLKLIPFVWTPNAEWWIVDVKDLKFDVIHVCFYSHLHTYIFSCFLFCKKYISVFISFVFGKNLSCFPFFFPVLAMCLIWTIKIHLLHWLATFANLKYILKSAYCWLVIPTNFVDYL